MKKNSILIIEDDKDVRETLADIVSSCGHDVHEAGHGQEALDRLQLIPLPSLIFLDAMMPVMDGPTFFAEFRKNEKHHSVPVILFSAVTDKINIDGLAGKLKKPANVDEILDLVTKYCGE